MKQKNLVLMVVAVGCGLVAAFLTSQMSGRTQAGPQMQDIVVAAKELPPGTKFTKESVKDLLKTVKRNPDSVPQNVVSEEELDGKTLIKTLRADDHIVATDLGVYNPILPPAGKELITVKLPIDKMTPFVKPTSRVDLMGVIVSQAQKVRGTVLIPKMLVMAIDVQTMPNPGTTGSITISMVTLAASQDEAKLIRMAEIAGVNLSFILLGEQGGTDAAKDWSIDQVIKWINDATLENPRADAGGPNDNPNANPTPAPTTPVPAAPTTVKILVPAEDLEPGTQLSSEVLDKKFKEIDWAANAVPENAVTAIREKVGKFLIKPVFAGYPVPKSAIGDKPPVKETPPDVATPKADGTPEPKEAPKPEKKKPTMDQTFQSPSGTKTYRYEQQETGKWKLLGEVQADGSVAPTAAPAAPTGPPAAPQPPAPTPPAGPADPRLS